MQRAPALRWQFRRLNYFTSVRSRLTSSSNPIQSDLRIPRLVHLRVLRFSEDERTAKWFSVIFTDLLHLISLVNSHEASLSFDVVFSISWWKFAPQGLHPAEDLYGHSSSHVCRELLQGLPAHGRFWVSWKQNKSHHTDQCHAVQTTL